MLFQVFYWPRRQIVRFGYANRKFPCVEIERAGDSCRRVVQSQVSDGEGSLKPTVAVVESQLNGQSAPPSRASGGGDRGRMPLEGVT